MANPIRVVALTGLSGTGKTSVAELFQRRNPKTVFLMPSLTRAAFQEFGVKTEKDKAKLSKDKESELQQFLLDYFIRHTKEQLRTLKGSGYEYLVVQRSVTDYLAYISKDIPVTLYSTHLLTQKAANWLTSVKPLQVFFPYPAPWMKDGQGEDDGFRGASIDKNYLKDLAVEEIIWHRRLKDACSNPNRNPLTRFGFDENMVYLSDAKDYSVEQRVAQIEKVLNVQTRPNFAL